MFQKLISSAGFLLITTVQGVSADSSLIESAIETTGLSWEGSYAGVQAGWNDVGLDWNVNAIPGSFANGRLDQLSFGLFAGHNFQKDVFIYSIEGEIEWLDGDERFSPVLGPAFVNLGNAGIGWSASLKARLGMDRGMYLPYVFGGVSWAELDTTATILGGLPPGLVPSQSDIHSGLAVGAGIDIQFTDKSFLRLEYAYSEFGKKEYRYCAIGCPLDISFDRHAVKIGLARKF